MGVVYQTLALCEIVHFYSFLTQLSVTGHLSLSDNDLCTLISALVITAHAKTALAVTGSLIVATWLAISGCSYPSASPSELYPKQAIVFSGVL